MTKSIQEPLSDIPSAAACAEAAAWIAKLHADDRTANIEAGFKRWLAASAEHRAAFEMANDIWESTEQLPKPTTPAFVRWPRGGLVITVPRALLAAGIVAALAVGISFYPWDLPTATRVGEQRNFTLEDGTHVALNTASRIHVHYDRTARRVELDEGEAYFEVAKHPKWPFIVTAGARQVVARGTAFLVRRDEDMLAVTLLEGNVTVTPVGKSVTSLPSASLPSVNASQSTAAGRSEPVAGREITLSAGQRLTFADHEGPRIDRPALERVTAWQRGQVILDHTSLADAVAEMNRYSRVELKIKEPDARRAEVTGIFRSGDSEAFAQAVAETYHLQVADQDGKIILSGLPNKLGGESTQK